MNYVQQREQELKEKFRIEMWWIGMVKLWEKLGNAMSIKREMDYWTDEFNKVRSEHIRKGRPKGYSPKKAAA